MVVRSRDFRPTSLVLLHRGLDAVDPAAAKRSVRLRQGLPSQGTPPVHEEALRVVR
jgi:hypothetical protein